MLVACLDVGRVRGSCSVSEEQAESYRRETIPSLALVWRAGGSAAAKLAEHFKGITPLFISPGKLQFALEHFGGVAKDQSAAMAADLRHRLLQAASVERDPMIPRWQTEPVPPALTVVDREDQVVSMWMRILSHEVHFQL